MSYERKGWLIVSAAMAHAEQLYGSADGDAELDGLLAYFHAMRARKHDPDAHAPAGHAP